MFSTSTVLSLIIMYLSAIRARTVVEKCLLIHQQHSVMVLVFFKTCLGETASASESRQSPCTYIVEVSHIDVMPGDE